MKDENNTPSLSKNYIYNLILQILSLLTPLITTPYISRVLGADGIGAYSYAASIMSYFTLFGNLGIATYGQLKIAQIRDDQEATSKIFWEIMLAKLFTMSIAIVVYAGMLCFPVRGRLLLLIMAIGLVASGIDVLWYFMGIEDFKKIVIRNITAKLLIIISIFIFVHQKSDLNLYVLLIQLASLLPTISMWFYIPKRIQRVPLKTLRFWQHWKYSLPYFVPAVATSVYTVLDKSMIGWITHSDYQNGYYEQAHKVEQLLITVLTSFSGVFLPRMAYLYAKKEYEEIKQKLSFSIIFITFLAMPMMFGLIAIADELIPLFLGEGYEECVGLLKIFSLLIVAIGLNNVVGMQCIMPEGKQKEFNIGVIAGAIFNLIMNIILIPRFASVGAAVSTVVAETIILIVFAIYAKKYIAYKTYVSAIGKYGLAAVGMYVVLLFIGRYLSNTWLYLLLQILVGVIVYFGILLVVRDEMLLYFFEKLKEKLPHSA